MKTLLFHVRLRRSVQKGLQGLLLLCFLFSSMLYAQAPVAANGRLSVSDGRLVNSGGSPVQLRGMSTHGPQWYGSCINFSSLTAMVNDWGIDLLRLAMYVEEEGYVTNPAYWKGWINDMVALTEQHGIYCLIDWHVHDPGDPWANMDAARDFWTYMSQQHAGKEHVLYEICNEPNGVDWSRVKSYAEEIIPLIRANDPDAVIIVGTPNWSQDVDVAAAQALDFDNIMYALHFYAGSHGASLRQKAEQALAAGAAVFVTEWGTSMANGDGGPYISASEEWLTWMKDKGLSWCNWSYADKDEVSAALVEGSCLGGAWNSTSASGAFVKEALLEPADSWSGSQGNIRPVAALTAPQANAVFETGETFRLSAVVSDADGEVVLAEFFANEEKVGEAAGAAPVVEWQAPAAGNYGLTVKVTDNNGAVGVSSEVPVRILDEVVQYAYPDGLPHAVPGQFEGTHFDVGGEGIAYHDADAVHKGGGIRPEEGVDTEGTSGAGNVGYVVNDEWLEYTIDVASSGIYKAALNVASQPGGGAFRLEFNNEDLSGLVRVPSTGAWSSYQTLNIESLSLEAGIQVLRLYVVVGDFNFSDFQFTLVSETDPTPDPTPDPDPDPNPDPDPELPCAHPQAISLPFAFDGAGEYCWVLEENIGFINSWNLDLLEINGTDFTNTWSNTLPAPIDGKYYIRYEAAYAWSHFEIPQSKVATSDVVIGQAFVSALPNPFVNDFVLRLPAPDQIRFVRVYDLTGRLLESYSGSSLKTGLRLGSKWPSGVYMLQIEGLDNKQVIKLIKK